MKRKIILTLGVILSGICLLGNLVWPVNVGTWVGNRGYDVGPGNQAAVKKNGPERINRVSGQTYAPREVSRGIEKNAERIRRNREKQPKTYVMVATAYSHTGSKTASGTWPKNGTVAADWNVLPRGTIVLIDGKKYVVEDKGGFIKKNRIDIFMESEKEAVKFGRKKVKVTVYE